VFGAAQFPRKRNQIRMTAFVRFLKGQPFLAKLRFGQCSIFVYRLHFLFDGVSGRFRMGRSFGDVFRASVSVISIYLQFAL
jgi:hypothetical protein